MWTFIISLLKYPDKYPARPVLYPSFLILVNEKWDLDDQSSWSLLEQHSPLFRMQREEEEEEAAAVWLHDPWCQQHLLSLGKSNHLLPFSQAIHLSAMSNCWRKTFLHAMLTKRVLLGQSRSVLTPCQGESPHGTFWSWERYWYDLHLSTCYLQLLTMPFAVQPCGSPKALSLECEFTCAEIDFFR